MARFSLTRDANGYVDYGLINVSTGGEYFVLQANSELTFTLPTTYAFYKVLFSYQPGTTVWVGYGSSSTSLPNGGVQSTIQELNPSLRRYPGGTTLRFITSDVSAEVGVRFDGE